MKLGLDIKLPSYNQMKDTIKTESIVFGADLVTGVVFGSTYVGLSSLYKIFFNPTEKSFFEYPLYSFTLGATISIVAGETTLSIYNVIRPLLKLDKKVSNSKKGLATYIVTSIAIHILFVKFVSIISGLAPTSRDKSELMACTLLPEFIKFSILALYIIYKKRF